MAVQKFPPPPQFAEPQFQQLNRWLIGIQRILNAGGAIDPSNVDGLVAAYATIAAHTAQIAANTANIATNTAHIATNTANIAANTASIAATNAAVAALAVRVTALEARNQILNGNGIPGAGLGNDGDLYIDDTGAPGSRLYGKIVGAWVLIA